MSARRSPAPLAALRREFTARGIRQVKVGGFDVDGIFRGKYLGLDKFWGAAQAGFGFCDVVFGWDVGDELYDNSKVTGWHTGYPDTLARIDLSTFRVIPWEPDTAAFIVDFFEPGGAPLEVSPRQLLQRVVAQARAMGLRVKCGAEFEFFLFRETAGSLRQKNFRNLATLSPGMFGYSWIRTSEAASLVHALLDGLAAFDIPIEGLHTETGPGVFEAALGYDDLPRAADKAALFKTAVKEIASRHGLVACFMAKWNPDLPGCSGHLHQSIWDLRGEKNLFAGGGKAHGLSPNLASYVAGQLALMPELTALVWPTVNSYKRSVPNSWAPLTATWGLENRTCALRVIRAGPRATRVEFRQSGSDINPYVAMATSVAAGLYGLRERLELPPPTVGNGYQGDGDRAAVLPRDLGEAVAKLLASRWAREALGEGFVEHYARTREWEWRKYQRAVTDWELARYFEAI